MGMLSMTGFGRGEACGDGAKVVVELSAVNRKQFDCHLTLPRDLVVLESKLHALVHARVRRGQVKGTLQVASAERRAVTLATLDRVRARARVEAVRELARELKLPDDLSARDLLRLPDLFIDTAHPSDPLRLWPCVARAAEAALDGLETMRRREGAALARGMQRGLAGLRRLATAVERRALRVPAAYRQTLRRRLAEFGGTANCEVLAREVALFADKTDIREELARIASHCDQAAKLMAGDEPCGRPLDFLCQELFREIGTIGAKANDAAIARLVIQFKSDLEAIREQVQNIE